MVAINLAHSLHLLWSCCTLWLYKLEHTMASHRQASLRYLLGGGQNEERSKEQPAIIWGRKAGVGRIGVENDW